MESIIIEKTGKNDSRFEDLKWVLKARDLKNKDKGFQGVLVEDKLIVATDGHRMHTVVSDLEIPNGDYLVVNANTKQIVLSKSDISHPDFLKIFPANEGYNIKIHCGCDDSLFFRAIYRNFSDDVTWNTSYLHDAFMSNSEISISGGNSFPTPLCLYDNDRRAALVAPIRVAED